MMSSFLKDSDGNLFFQRGNLPIIVRIAFLIFGFLTLPLSFLAFWSMDGLDFAAWILWGLGVFFIGIYLAVGRHPICLGYDVWDLGDVVFCGRE